MKVGYARVSTHEQDLQIQIDQLNAYGCNEVHSEEASGIATERPVLSALSLRVKDGDEIVVCKLDRLSRSVRECLELVEDWHSRGVALTSIAEPFINTSAGGKLMMQVLAMVAEFERNRLRERTLEGMAQARRRGKHLGAAFKLTKEQHRSLLKLRADGVPISSLSRQFGLSNSSIYRYLNNPELDLPK